MSMFDLNKIKKLTQIKERNKRAQRREIIRYFTHMKNEDFNFLNPLLDGDLFKSKGRQLALNCDKLSVENICGLFIKRAYYSGRSFVQKQRTKKHVVYAGLFERVAEIRLAAALHKNGVIDLLDQLNLGITKKFYLTNEQMCAGVVIRKYPPMRPVESVSTAILRTSNCSNCCSSTSKIFKKVSKTGVYGYFKKIRY